MVGRSRPGFPRINLLSWYLYIFAAAIATYVIVSGGVDTGWTFYTPYSTMASNTHVFSTAFAAFIVGFSSILTGLNFIVTIHKMRAPGLTWFRLPLFIWAQYATSLIMILATPVLAIHDGAPVCSSASSASASSIPTSAAIRCFSSICSGSIPIPRSTS